MPLIVQNIADCVDMMTTIKSTFWTVSFKDSFHFCNLLLLEMMGRSDMTGCIDKMRRIILYFSRDKEESRLTLIVTIQRCFGKSFSFYLFTQSSTLLRSPGTSYCCLMWCNMSTNKRSVLKGMQLY